MSRLGQKLIAAAKQALAMVRKPPPKMHSGKCDRCDEQFLVWLGDGKLLCWEHYCDEMQKGRFR